MNKKNFIDRFVTYAKINTQSDPHSNTVPTSKNQFDLARLLVSELEAMNIEAELDQEKAFVYAKIPANVDKKVASVAYLAHMDTAPDYSGENVMPIVVDNYDGSDIIFADGEKLSKDKFPTLNDVIGDTIIHTDGTTLLGADDKSGITIIMEMLKYYVENPNVKHGNINACFTIDEEVGRGAKHVDIEKLDSDFAYTIDGGELGEFSYETFNACSVDITFKGLSVHPGSAKNKLVNSLNAANYLHSLLPESERPETTELKEGFYHLHDLNGNIELTTMNYIIRDHDSKNFLRRKEFITSCFNLTKERYNIEGEIKISDSYLNMNDKITNEFVKTMPLKAMENINIISKLTAVRGGTDGSILTYRGLPTPNLFVGGYNFHGKYEFLSVDSMMKCSELLIEMNDIILNK